MRRFQNREVISIEIWKDISGYEGYYQVSSYGQVRSLDRVVGRSDGKTIFKKGIVLAPKQSEDGYLAVTLCKDGKGKFHRIHRLVAEAFLPHVDGCDEVNHIDFDRKNNVVSNLEWCSHSENVEHSATHGRYKIRDFHGSNNPNYGSGTLKKKFQSGELSTQILARPGAQNGRATKISIYDLDKNYIAEFDWIGGCANFVASTRNLNASIGCIRDGIARSIRNDKPYHGYYYVKH